MNIFKELQLNSEKPVALSIKKTEKSQIMAVGLGKGAIMKSHKTSTPATLIIVKGDIDFSIENEMYHFTQGDIYEIPVEILHEVTGVGEENIFLINKEL